MPSLSRNTSVMKTANLQSRLLDLIGRGVGHETSDAEFNALALEVVEFQFALNPIYRGWCESRKLTPATVAHWKQIPAVPTSAFKDFALTCFPVEEAVAEFHTSGTTREKSGKHYFKTLELYDAAIVPNFEAHLVGTDRWAVRNGNVVAGFSLRSESKRTRKGCDYTARPAVAPYLFILTPSPEEEPRSSLSHMMGVVAERMKYELGGMRAEDLFFIRNGKLESERLVRALRGAEESGETAVLLGTAFSFVHFFEHCEREKLCFDLPEGSRAMETGGFKGKSREMPKRELYELFEKYVGIPSSRVVNEYGMTELSTQFYDETLREKSEIRNPKSEGNPKSKIQNLKSVPPWARVMIVDPRTGKEAVAGERGLIRVFDLANLYSVMAIQTEDLGVRRGDGFEVLGRASAAEARGCSIAADEILGQN